MPNSFEKSVGQMKICCGRSSSKSSKSIFSSSKSILAISRRCQQYRIRKWRKEQSQRAQKKAAGQDWNPGEENKEIAQNLLHPRKLLI